MGASGRSGGDGAGPAGASLADSSLINPHSDVLWAEAAYELEVHAVRKLLGRIPPRRRMKRQLVEAVREAHRMRIANIRRHRLELGSVGRADEDQSSSDSNRAHGHADSAVRQRHRLPEATPRSDPDDRPVDQTLV